MNCLELFSGTGSFGKVAKKLNYNVISLDLILEADIQEDILKWDYKKYPPDTFNIIWASPPCTNYSRLKNSLLNRPMKNGIIYNKEIMESEMLESDKIVLKTLEIIDYFKPKLWFIENPQGRLRHRNIMKNIPYYTVDYCMYSDWGYKKRTNIWTNNTNFVPLTCNKKCGNIKNNIHTNNLGNYQHSNVNNTKLPSTLQKYRIPEKLIFSLLIF